MFRIAPWTKLLVVLSCWLWMSTTTGAFNYNYNIYYNNAGIGSSIITINYSNPHTGNRRPQQSRTQPPPQRRVISLCSSTALTSPLQPVPEESSTINDNIGISDIDDDDSNNSIQLSSTTNTGVQGDQKIQSTKQRQKLEYIQSEGGRFSFNTKYGALNPFAIYYGITSIVLGLPWFMALTVYQFLQLITFRRFDRLRRIPVLLNQLWGESLMVLTRCYPEMIHRDILQKFYKEYVTSAAIIVVPSYVKRPPLTLTFHSLFLCLLSLSEVDPPCLWRITIHGWTFHSWGLRLDGKITSSYRKRNWPRYRFWERRLKSVDISWYHEMIRDRKLKR